jgi:hypothetical protein
LYARRAGELAIEWLCRGWLSIPAVGKKRFAKHLFQQHLLR